MLAKIIEITKLSYQDKPVEISNLYKDAAAAVFNKDNKRYFCCPPREEFVVISLESGMHVETDIRYNKKELNVMLAVISGSPINDKKYYIEEIKKQLIGASMVEDSGS